MLLSLEIMIYFQNDDQVLTLLKLKKKNSATQSYVLTNLRKNSCKNIVGKGEYAGNQHFFSTMFSIEDKLII